MGLHLCFFLFHFAFANSVVSVQFSNVSFLKSSVSLLTQFLYQITTFCFICFASFVLLFFLSLYFPIGTVILNLHTYILVFLCLCLVKYIVASIPFLVPCPCLRGMTLQRLFYYSSSCLSGHSCNWCF